MLRDGDDARLRENHLFGEDSVKRSAEGRFDRVCVRLSSEPILSEECRDSSPDGEPINPRAKLNDLANSVRARDERERLSRVVETSDHKKIAKVERSSGHPNSDLAMTKRERRPLFGGEVVQPKTAAYGEDVHGTLQANVALSCGAGCADAPRFFERGDARRDLQRLQDNVGASRSVSQRVVMVVKRYIEGVADIR